MLDPKKDKSKAKTKNVPRASELLMGGTETLDEQLREQEERKEASEKKIAKLQSLKDLGRLSEGDENNLKIELKIAEEMNADLVMLDQNMNELTDFVNDIKILMEEQQAIINSIDDHVVNSINNLQKGRRYIYEAYLASPQSLMKAMLFLPMMASLEKYFPGINKLEPVSPGDPRKEPYQMSDILETKKRFAFDINVVATEDDLVYYFLKEKLKSNKSIREKKTSSTHTPASSKDKVEALKEENKRNKEDPTTYQYNMWEQYKKREPYQLINAYSSGDEFTEVQTVKKDKEESKKTEKKNIDANYVINYLTGSKQTDAEKESAHLFHSTSRLVLLPTEQLLTHLDKIQKFKNHKLFHDEAFKRRALHAERDYVRALMEKTKVDDMEPKERTTAYQYIRKYGKSPVVFMTLTRTSYENLREMQEQDKPNTFNKVMGTNLNTKYEHLDRLNRNIDQHIYDKTIRTLSAGTIQKKRVELAGHLKKLFRLENNDANNYYLSIVAKKLTADIASVKSAKQKFDGLMSTALPGIVKTETLKKIQTILANFEKYSEPSDTFFDQPAKQKGEEKSVRILCSFDERDTKVRRALSQEDKTYKKLFKTNQLTIPKELEHRCKAAAEKTKVQDFIKENTNNLEGKKIAAMKRDICDALYFYDHFAGKQDVKLAKKKLELLLKIIDRSNPSIYEYNKTFDTYDLKSIGFWIVEQQNEVEQFLDAVATYHCDEVEKQESSMLDWSFDEKELYKIFSFRKEKAEKSQDSHPTNIFSEQIFINVMDDFFGSQEREDEQEDEVEIDEEGNLVEREEEKEDDLGAKKSKGILKRLLRRVKKFVNPFVRAKKKEESRAKVSKEQPINERKEEPQQKPQQQSSRPITFFRQRERAMIKLGLFAQMAPDTRQRAKLNEQEQRIVDKSQLMVDLYLHRDIDDLEAYWLKHNKHEDDYFSGLIDSETVEIRRKELVGIWKNSEKITKKLAEALKELVFITREDPLFLNEVKISLEKHSSLTFQEIEQMLEDMKFASLDVYSGENGKAYLGESSGDGIVFAQLNRYGLATDEQMAFFVKQRSDIFFRQQNAKFTSDDRALFSGEVDGQKVVESMNDTSRQAEKREFNDVASNYLFSRPGFELEGRERLKRAWGDVAPYLNQENKERYDLYSRTPLDELNAYEDELELRSTRKGSLLALLGRTFTQIFRLKKHKEKKPKTPRERRREQLTNLKTAEKKGNYVLWDEIEDVEDEIKAVGKKSRLLERLQVIKPQIVRQAQHDVCNAVEKAKKSGRSNLSDVLAEQLEKIPDTLQAAMLNSVDGVFNMRYIFMAALSGNSVQQTQAWKKIRVFMNQLQTSKHDIDKQRTELMLDIIRAPFENIDGGISEEEVDKILKGLNISAENRAKSSSWDDDIDEALQYGKYNVAKFIAGMFGSQAINEKVTTFLANNHIVRKLNAQLDMLGTENESGELAELAQQFVDIKIPEKKRESLFDRGEYRACKAAVISRFRATLNKYKAIKKQYNHLDSVVEGGVIKFTSTDAKTLQNLVCLFDLLPPDLQGEIKQVVNDASYFLLEKTHPASDEFMGTTRRGEKNNLEKSADRHVHEEHFFANHSFLKTFHNKLNKKNEYERYNTQFTGIRLHMVGRQVENSKSDKAERCDEKFRYNLYARLEVDFNNTAAALIRMATRHRKNTSKASMFGRGPNDKGVEDKLRQLSLRLYAETPLRRSLFFDLLNVIENIRDIAITASKSERSTSDGENSIDNLSELKKMILDGIASLGQDSLSSQKSLMIDELTYDQINMVLQNQCGDAPKISAEIEDLMLRFACMQKARQIVKKKFLDTTDFPAYVIPLKELNHEQQLFVEKQYYISQLIEEIKCLKSLPNSKESKNLELRHRLVRVRYELESLIRWSQDKTALVLLFLPANHPDSISTALRSLLQTTDIKEFDLIIHSIEVAGLIEQFEKIDPSLKNKIVEYKKAKGLSNSLVSILSATLEEVHSCSFEELLDIKFNNPLPHFSKKFRLYISLEQQTKLWKLATSTLGIPDRERNGSIMGYSVKDECLRCIDNLLKRSETKRGLLLSEKEDEIFPEASNWLTVDEIQNVMNVLEEYRNDIVKKQKILNSLGHWLKNPKNEELSSLPKDSQIIRDLIKANPELLSDILKEMKDIADQTESDFSQSHMAPKAAANLALFLKKLEDQTPYKRFMVQVERIKAVYLADLKPEFKNVEFDGFLLNPEKYNDVSGRLPNKFEKSDGVVAVTEKIKTLSTFPQTEETEGSEKPFNVNRFARENILNIHMRDSKKAVSELRKLEKEIVEEINSVLRGENDEVKRLVDKCEAWKSTVGEDLTNEDVERIRLENLRIIFKEELILRIKTEETKDKKENSLDFKIKEKKNPILLARLKKLLMSVENKDVSDKKCILGIKREVEKGVAAISVVTPMKRYLSRMGLEGDRVTFDARDAQTSGFYERLDRNTKQWKRERESLYSARDLERHFDGIKAFHDEVYARNESAGVVGMLADVSQYCENDLGSISKTAKTNFIAAHGRLLDELNLLKTALKNVENDSKHKRSFVKKLDFLKLSGSSKIKKLHDRAEDLYKNLKKRPTFLNANLLAKIENLVTDVSSIKDIKPKEAKKFSVVAGKITDDIKQTRNQFGIIKYDKYLLERLGYRDVSGPAQRCLHMLMEDQLGKDLFDIASDFTAKTIFELGKIGEKRDAKIDVYLTEISKEEKTLRGIKKSMTQIERSIENSNALIEQNDRKLQTLHDKQADFEFFQAKRSDSLADHVTFDMEEEQASNKIELAGNIKVLQNETNELRGKLMEYHHELNKFKKTVEGYETKIDKLKSDLQPKRHKIHSEWNKEDMACRNKERKEVTEIFREKITAMIKLIKKTHPNTHDVILYPILKKFNHKRKKQSQELLGSNTLFGVLKDLDVLSTSAYKSSKEQRKKSRRSQSTGDLSKFDSNQSKIGDVRTSQTLQLEDLQDRKRKKIEEGQMFEKLDLEHEEFEHEEFEHEEFEHEEFEHELYGEKSEEIEIENPSRSISNPQATCYRGGFHN